MWLKTMTIVVAALGLCLLITILIEMVNAQTATLSTRLTPAAMRCKEITDCPKSECVEFVCKEQTCKVAKIFTGEKCKGTGNDCVCG